MFENGSTHGTNEKRVNSRDFVEMARDVDIEKKPFDAVRINRKNGKRCIPIPISYYPVDEML